jgi:hypothetical protein
VQSLPFNIEYQDRVRQVVNQHFHTDVFMMMSQLAQSGHSERMVVEQVMELQGEKAAILGTRVGNLQSEAFDPLIYRIYSIEAEAGRIPQPPDILLETQHGPVEVEYLGPLAQAQTRLNTVRTIQTCHTIITQLAQLNPTVIDVIDADKEAMMVLDKLGYPVECLRDPRMIQLIRQHRTQMQEQERQAEIVPKMAKAAAALSKAPESGSALKQLMSGGAATTENVD